MTHIEVLRQKLFVGVPLEQESARGMQLLVKSIWPSKSPGTGMVESDGELNEHLLWCFSVQTPIAVGEKNLIACHSRKR